VVPPAFGIAPLRRVLPLHGPTALGQVCAGRDRVAGGRAVDGAFPTRGYPVPGRKASEQARRDQIVKAAYEVAARHGVDGLTVRLVATKARLSTGLVLFHFGSKDQLIVALLDWLLATTTVLHIGPEIGAIEAPLERLLALLRQEMDRLSSEPRRIRLFFEFWVMGGRHDEIGNKMRGELARYREAFRSMAEEVLRTEPERFPQVTADGLAGVAVSFIKGCAVQSMIDPEHFAIKEYLVAAEGLLGQLARPGAAGLG
jgi:TetR/AcrR family transcriptional regulator, transcriptional repressor of bet genes